MIREKWTWLALAVLATFVLLMLAKVQIRDLTTRVEKLERYIPYIEPTAK
jgi:hypothetical protein